MYSPSRTVLSLGLALTLASGCTLNVTPFEIDVDSETDASPTRLVADFEGTGVPVDGCIHVRGAERAGAAATITLAGLVGGADDSSEVARGLEVSWPTDEELVTELRIGYGGLVPESVWIQDVALELPIGADLEANAGDASFDVAGIDGDLMLTTGSGSMLVRDASEVVLDAGSGSIDVEAHSGSLETGSGSILLAFTGPVTGSAGSGSIAGSFGGHATMNTGSGSIDLELTTELDGDVVLGAGSGSVVLTIPTGAAVNLELGAGSGSVYVDAGDVSFDGESWAGAINGGGAFTVRIETGSGSVTVRERSTL